MRKIGLTYQFVEPDADTPGGIGAAGVHHPLFALLNAVHRTGSISAAARDLQLSYRHVWGELKRWEAEMGQPLIHWVKGQRAALAPFGEKLLWAERRAQARLAPQIESLRMELEKVFAEAFDTHTHVLSLTASHDMALPRLRELARDRHQLHIETAFEGSLQALQALNEGRCALAGFHVGDDAPRGCPSALAFRQHLRPGEHKLIGFAHRAQGLMVARGNPLQVASLADLGRSELRWVGRPPTSGSHLLMLDMLAARGQAAPGLERFAFLEPSHVAAAQAVASGAADAAFGLESAARAAGLDFVPLARERYFLVTLKSMLEEPAMQALLALLRSPAWATALADLAGYDLSESGQVLSLTRALPWWNYRTPKDTHRDSGFSAPAASRVAGSPVA